MSTIYEFLKTSKGATYSTNSITTRSWLHPTRAIAIPAEKEIKGISRVHGDVSLDNQKAVIDLIIEVGSRYNLNYKELAFALLMCRVESGYNPDAAAGTSSAGGLAQYTSDTVVSVTNGRSKKYLGFVLDMTGSKIFDAGVGAYATILSTLFHIDLAVKWGFSPLSANYWQLLYMLHHDGEGQYWLDAGRIRAQNFNWRADAIQAYNSGILPKLNQLTTLLKEKHDTQVALTDLANNPIPNQSYVVATVQNTTTIINQPAQASNASATTATNSLATPPKLKVVQGKTDAKGLTSPIKASVGDEIMLFLLPKDWRKISHSTSSKGDVTHKVKKGDTLSKIAKDNHTNVDDLAKANHIKDVNKLNIGQQIHLPSQSTHTVKHGDTLSSIAKQYGETVEDLKNSNHISNPNMIHAGDKIVVKRRAYLKQTPPNWILSKVLEHLGVLNANTGVFEYAENHIVMPKGSTAHSPDVSKPNTIVIVSPTVQVGTATAQPVMSKTTTSTQNTPQVVQITPTNPLIELTIQFVDQNNQHPIQNFAYVLEYQGKRKNHVSGAQGKKIHKAYVSEQIKVLISINGTLTLKQTITVAKGMAVTVIPVVAPQIQTSGEAVIYTFQDTTPLVDGQPKEGYTVFYDHLGNKLHSMPTWSRCDSAHLASHPGADGPYTGYYVRVDGGNRNSNLGVAYGTTKIITDDPRLRWVHGGGTSCPNPFAEHQGFRVTKGCTKAQNIDVENLAAKIKLFLTQNPGFRIKYIRNHSATYPK
jgi:LysM repeat protein